MATAFSEDYHVYKNKNHTDLVIKPNNYATQTNYEMAGDIKMATSLSSESHSKKINSINLKKHARIVIKSTPSSRVLILRKPRKKKDDSLVSLIEDHDKKPIFKIEGEIKNIPDISNIKTDVKLIQQDNSPGINENIVTSSSTITDLSSSETDLEYGARCCQSKQYTLWESADQRQVELERRIDRLMLRTRRLKCTQVITHGKQQLSAFASVHPIATNGKQLANIDLGPTPPLLKRHLPNTDGRVTTGELLEVLDRWRERIVSGPLTKVALRDSKEIHNNADQLMEQIDDVRAQWDSDITEESSCGEVDPEQENVFIKQPLCINIENRSDMKWIRERSVSKSKLSLMEHKVAAIEGQIIKNDIYYNVQETKKNKAKKLKSSIGSRSSLDENSSLYEKLDYNISCKQYQKTMKGITKVYRMNSSPESTSSLTRRSLCACDHGNHCKFCTPLFNSISKKRSPSLGLETCSQRVSTIADEHAYALPSQFSQDSILDSNFSNFVDNNDSCAFDSISTYKYNKFKETNLSMESYYSNNVLQHNDKLNKKRTYIKKNRKSETNCKKKKSENDFDIDNVVIPINCTSKVEKPKFKEIVTPKWRIINDEPSISNSGTISFDFINAELHKDTDDAEVTRRHSISESCEKRRFTAFQMACTKPRRSRSDSSSIVLSPSGFSDNLLVKILPNNSSDPFKPHIFPMTSEEISKAADNLMQQLHTTHRSLIYKQQSPSSCTPYFPVFHDTEDDYVDIMHTDPEWTINNNGSKYSPTTSKSSSYKDSGLIMKLSRKL